jgi:hypothetical protein
MENSDCLFYSGIVMPNQHIASIYKTRLEIARQDNKLSKDSIEDFEKAVSNLHSSESSQLALAAVYGEREGFLIFYEPERKIILGVLKSIEDDNNSLTEYGHSSGLQKYSKGVLVE